MALPFWGALVLAYVLRFTNPKISTSEDTLTLDSLDLERNTETIDFSGSKGFFVSFNGFTYSLSQRLDITLSGTISKKYFIKGRLLDSKADYGTDYYTTLLKDMDEIFFEVSDSSNNFLKFGKIALPEIKLLGFSGCFQNIGFSYGSTNTSTVKKELSVKYPNSGPYFVDYGYMIVPGSLKVIKGDEILDKSKYEFDYQSGILWIKDYDLFKGPDRFFVEYATYNNLPSVYGSFFYSSGGLKVVFEHLGSTMKYYEGIPDTLKKFLSQVGDIEDYVEFKGGIKNNEGSYNLQDSFFVFAGDGKGEYIVYFEFVGINRGSYIFDNIQGAYKYVGYGAGHYEPLFRIPAPREHNVISLTYNGKLSIDFKASYSDLNKLSKVGDSGNLGFKASLSKKVEINNIQLTSGVRWKTENFFDLKQYLNKFFGIESKGRLLEHFGNIHLDWANTFLEYTIGLDNKNPRSALRLTSNPGPFGILLNLTQTDTINAKLILSWLPSKLPHGFLIFQNTEKPLLVEIGSSLGNLNFSGGFVFSKDLRKIWPYLMVKILESGSRMSFFSEIFYLREYWSYPLYRLKLTYNLEGHTRMSLGTSKMPELVYYKEERFYKSPAGTYELDRSFGVYTPSQFGDFERHFLSLGIKDTSLGNTLEFELDSRSESRGFNIMLSQKRGVYDLVRSLIGQLKVGPHAATAYVTSFIDSSFVRPYVKKEERYSLEFFVCRSLWFTPMYERNVQDNLSYSYLSSSFDIRFKGLSIRFGPVNTWYKGGTYKTLSVQGSWYFIKDSWHGIFNLSINAPFGVRYKDLPYFVPTSERYAFNMNFKYKHKSGEFFVETLYTKSVQSVNKIRAGYNFLF